jgi:hypothetical protein
MRRVEGFDSLLERIEVPVSPFAEPAIDAARACADDAFRA